MKHVIIPKLFLASTYILNIGYFVIGKQTMVKLKSIEDTCKDINTQSLEHWCQIIFQTARWT